MIIGIKHIFIIYYYRNMTFRYGSLIIFLIHTRFFQPNRRPPSNRHPRHISTKFNKKYNRHYNPNEQTSMLSQPCSTISSNVALLQSNHQITLFAFNPTPTCNLVVRNTNLSGVITTIRATLALEIGIPRLVIGAAIRVENALVSLGIETLIA